MKNNFKPSKDGKNKKAFTASAGAKRAFTLAEALVVMLIVGIVAVAALHNMSKKAPQRSDEAQHGQYACWYDNSKGGWYEQDMEGGSIGPPRFILPGKKCTFTPPNRRMAIYTIYVVGEGVAPGNNNIQGQFISGNISAADILKPVEITFNGSFSDDPDVKGTKFGERRDFFARDGIVNVPNGLTLSNVNTNSCRLVVAPTSCAKGCTVVRSERVTNKEIKVIRIDGCRTKVLESIPTPDGTITTEVEMDVMIHPSDLTAVKKNETGFYDNRQYKGTANNNQSYIISIQLEDSDYTTPSFGGTSESRMAGLLSSAMLPKFRRTDIVTAVVSKSPGFGNNGKGAVFIMW